MTLTVGMWVVIRDLHGRYREVKIERIIETPHGTRIQASDNTVVVTVEPRQVVHED